VRPSLWRHELRRVGFPALAAPVAVPAALAIAGASMAALHVQHREGQIWLGAGLEIAAPLAAALPAAWTVASEPAVELQLSVPTPYRATVMKRLAITLAWSALLCLGVASALWVPGWWRLSIGFWAAQLTWLSPLLCLLATAVLAVLVLRSPSAAGGLVAVVWLLNIIVFGAFLSNRWLRNLHLFATTYAGPGASFWPSNRLVLAAGGLLALVAAWPLLCRSEHLLGGADET
jgi:uncharacterized membrane protein YwaF